MVFVSEPGVVFDSEPDTEFDTRLNCSKLCEALALNSTRCLTLTSTEAAEKVRSYGQR